MSMSILRNMLACKALRNGCGIDDLTVRGIESRRKERLFGATGNGRTKSRTAGIKIEKIGAEYEPSDDTCIKAFIRWIADVAKAVDGS